MQFALSTLPRCTFTIMSIVYLFVSVLLLYVTLAGYPLHGLVVPTPPPPHPRGGVGQNLFNFFSGQFMTFPGLLFDFFDPLKFPLRPPLVGGGGFAFKDTISRHFAGYASVALETIWLHEPRDVIFLGPLMTVLCLSRYSGMGEVLFTHADCRRM